jgi:hypothetical protein
MYLCSSARLALYNHNVLILASRPSLERPLWNQTYQAKSGVEDSTVGITENLKELVQLKLARYLPISV